MSRLLNITEIPSDVTSLLGSVGCLFVRDLVSADVESLYDELTKANQTLKVLAELPSRDQIVKWQSALEGVDDEPVENKTKEVPKRAETTNFEGSPEWMALLSTLAEVEILTEAMIEESQLSMKNIPEALLLSHCDSEQGMQILADAEGAADVSSEIESQHPNSRKFRGFHQINESGRVKPLDRGAPRSVVAVRKETNKGLKPSSRRFIRGVLHPHPSRLMLSAFFTIWVQCSLVVAVIGIPLLLLHEHLNGKNMIPWILAIAISLLISSLSYLFGGMGASCRICGQRQFVPKKCIKNKKAHRIPVIGYILPTAIQALLFRWFYCIYCGTPVRLRK